MAEACVCIDGDVLSAHRCASHILKYCHCNLLLCPHKVTCTPHVRADAEATVLPRTADLADGTRQAVTSAIVVAASASASVKPATVAADLREGSKPESYTIGTKETDGKTMCMILHTACLLIVVWTYLHFAKCCIGSSLYAVRTAQRRALCTSGT